MREQSKHRGVKLFFMLFIAIICFFMISADAAYPTLSSRYGVILSNASSKKRTIYVDLTGSVNVSANPSVRYYSTVDIGGKLYNSIAPAKGTKMTWLGDIPGIDYGYKTYTSQGGSVSGGWQNNKKSAINLNSVDATASTPYIRLPKVSRAGYTFTGWTVSETQTPYVYYNRKYRKSSSLNPTYNPGVKLGSDGYYYIEVGAYSTIKTVKPTWRANNFYVRYHANGGSGYMADQTFTYGVSQNLRRNTFTRTGYTFSGWKVHREYDNTWAWAEGHGNGNYWQSGEPWGSDIRIYSDGGSIAKTTYSGYVNMYAQWTPNYYYLDVNGLLDGKATGNTAGYGTFDVYINGNLVANDVTDFYQQYAYGTKYEIKDIKSNTGKTYNGASSGRISGTIGTSNSIQLKFTTTQYSNSISHWMWGFTKGEGNNGSRNAYNIANTSFTSKYGNSYVMDSSKAVTVPKGFYLVQKFGTSSISGSWNTYSFGTTVTQKPNGMSFEYDYQPITYSIKYNLGGGTNNSSNPSSYNILYGVNFKNPTRKGYKFLGWYKGNTKVTGINVGVTNNFSSPSNMYSRLNSRSTGDITLTAKWEVINPEMVVKKNIYYQDEDVTLSKLVSDNAKATDVVEGNISNKIKITKIVYPDGRVVNNPSNFDTSVVGTCTITYRVETERGGVAEKTSTVDIISIIPPGTPIVNEDATIYSRYIGNIGLSDGSNARDSLETNSIWRKNSSYASVLNESLSKGDDDFISRFRVR